MSPRLINEDDETTSVPVKLFRGANGNTIILEELEPIVDNKDSRIVQFDIKNGEKKINIKIDSIIILLILFIWTFTDYQLITVVGGIVYGFLRIKGIITTVDTDTLLVVESVGVQIIGKKLLPCFESSIFLPWNTVKDVFINEVITGHRVLFFLTFIVKDSSCGKDSIKLVPLFCELKPERKCLEYINQEEFAHDHELMKVVRRIIKINPRQGQQFCTRHLLVTYNHSSWTRQDKMFAMLKFRDRPDATAYPHAFILTIKPIAPDFKDNFLNYDTSSQKWECLQSPKKNNPSRTVNSIDVSTKSSRIPSSNDGKNPENAVDKRSFFNFSSKLEKSTDNYEPKTVEEKASDDPMNDIQETADMPYQYLIEREIEKTKAKIARNAQIKSDKSEKLNEKKTNDLKLKNTSLTDNSSRSSNITDLVMEGLMFTIRQDKDSITVVEQKTKLEPDEVLENSEKIETIEGSECLVNSSLLKLENLITKIEMSCDNKKILPAPLFSLNSSFNNCKITGNSGDRVSKGLNNEIHGDGNVEDEEIIPEACRNKQTSNLLKGSGGKKNLDEDEGSSDDKFKKVPRIVSSEVVKYDLSLLRTAKGKRTRDSSSDESHSDNDAKSEANDKVPINSDDEKRKERKVLVGKRRIPNEDDIRIDMLKFVKDMTLGVRVVVQRLDIDTVSTVARKNSFLRVDKKIH